MKLVWLFSLFSLVTGEMNGAPVFTGFLSGIGGIKVQSLMIPTTHDAEYYPKLNSILIAACQALYPFSYRSVAV